MRPGFQTSLIAISAPGEGIKPEIESLASRTSSAALQLRSTQNDNALAALTLQRFKDLTI
jgi:hypothetical protein